MQAAYRRALRIAAATGQGLLVPMGFEFGARRRMDARRATPRISRRTGKRAPRPGRGDRGGERSRRRLARAEPPARCAASPDPGAPVSTLLQFDAADVRASDEGILVLINNDDKPQPLPTIDTLPPAAGAAVRRTAALDDDPEPLLAAGEVRVMSVTRTQAGRGSQPPHRRAWPKP